MSDQGLVLRELGPEDLGPRIDPGDFPFETTAEVEPRHSPLGQERALRSLRLGIRMAAPGYNVFVVGLTGHRKEALLKDLVATAMPTLPAPPDWVYVHNFHDPDRPKAIRLEAGQGRTLVRDLEQLLEGLKKRIPETFQQETFEKEKQALAEKYDTQIKALRQEFEASAAGKNLHVHPTQQGQLLFIPAVDGKPIEDSSEYEALPEEQKREINENQEALGKEAREMFKKQKALMEEMGHEVEQTVKLHASRIIDPMIGAIAERYDNPRVREHLAQLRDHALENLEQFREGGAQPANVPLPAQVLQSADADRFLPFQVNAVVHNAPDRGAPVLTEESPTYRNLFGTIEKVVDQTGKLVTNFTRIKSGKILRASGGCLVFNLEDAITEPFVWKSLKRVLRTGSVEIESYQPFNFLSVAGLQPEPIPVNPRVVVFGSRLLFQILQFWDPDFSDIFKVMADFDYETDGDAGGVIAYAQRIAHLTQVERLVPFHRDAVAEVVRFGARQAAHKEKLSAVLADLDDLVREASFFAGEVGAELVRGEHVRAAEEDRLYRWSRIEDKVRELIAEGTLLVDVTGERVGQVNGLAVLSMGQYAFGRPSRVSASVGLGSAGIVNIEREAKLSGATHDKGVLILTGFLRSRFGRKRPLSLTASIAFEQSYSGVDGDSASSTELYALLSRIGNLSMRQDVAVTGSVNQAGEIQAVGGVNEKVEGFYRVCQAVGLSGKQGVMIPEANVRHLVLHPEVIAAVRDGKFHIYPVRTVEEGMEVLTGIPAGDPGVEGTIFGRLEAALEELDRDLRERNERKRGRAEDGADKADAKEREEEETPGGEHPPPKPPEPEPG